MNNKNENKITDENNSSKEILNLYYSGKYKETIELCDLVLVNNEQIIEILDIKAGAFMALNDFDKDFNDVDAILTPSTPSSAFR